MVLALEDTKETFVEASIKEVLKNESSMQESAGVTEIENTKFVSSDVESENSEIFVTCKNLVDLLQTIHEIYVNCLNPTEDTLDDRMGIRRCVNRMSRIHSISSGKLAGIPAAALILHRPQRQVSTFIYS